MSANRPLDDPANSATSASDRTDHPARHTPQHTTSAHAATPPHARDERSSSRETNTTCITITAAALIVAATVIRAIQVSQRTLYWDDLIIPAYFGDFSPTSPSTWGVLFRSYDGHIMPASAALQWATQHLAPLRWWLPALIIIVATAGCGWLWWRVAVALRGRSISALVTLTFLLFSPFLMAAAGWWSTAVNALAWQAGMAGVTLCVLAARPTPSPRPTATVATRSILAATITFTAIALAGLLFTEKALSLIPAAFVIALLVRLPRRQWSLFVLPGALWVLWLVLYLRLSEIPDTHNPESITGALPGAVFRALIPGMLGGPLWWERWRPSTAFAATPLAWSIISAVVVAVVVVVWLRRDPRTRLVALVAIVGYAAALLIALVTARAGAQSSGVLTLNLHYYTDWFAFAVVAVAACPPAPAGAQSPSVRRHTRRVPYSVVGVSLFVLISVLSTATWVWAWRDDPTKAYLANLRQSVYVDRQPLLDQTVPLEVLLPFTEPYNHVSTVTGVPAVSAIDEPTMIGESGRVVDAGIMAVASNEQSPGEGIEPGCGVRIMAGEQRVIPLSGALPFGEWTWQLNAAATAPLEVRITTPNGLETLEDAEARATTVQVGTDLRPQWVRVSGGGGLIALRVSGPAGASLCVGQGEIGPFVPLR